jgi:CRP-like cAMP-binding protein
VAVLLREVEVKRKMEGDEIQIIRLGSGTFFGEQALITQEPRMASVIAIGVVECLRLDKPSFEVLMGPCEEALAANAQLYEVEATNARQSFVKKRESAIEAQATTVSCTAPHLLSALPYILAVPCAGG